MNHIVKLFEEQSLNFIRLVQIINSVLWQLYIILNVVFTLFGYHFLIINDYTLIVWIIVLNN